MLGELQRDDIADFVLQMKEQQDARDQWKLFRRKARSLGFDKLTYAFLPSLNSQSSCDDLMWVDGYPKGWREHYNENSYVHDDVVVRHCLTAENALDWSCFGVNIRNNVYTEKEAEVIIRGRDFGLSRGISFPLRDNLGCRGGVSFCPESGLSEREFARHLAHSRQDLMALGEVLHALLDRKTLSVRDKDLTPRELEALKWTFGGKSQKVIAHKMGISEQMVGKHMVKIKKKLNASNIKQVTAKAIYLNLLD